MKQSVYRAVSLLLLFNAPWSFAGSEDLVNLSFGPDVVTHCHQYRVDFSITANSTLGVMGAYNCKNRPDRPVNGSMVMNGLVTNTFNRIIIPWRYAPRGVFHDGFFVEALVGTEWSKYRSVAGSSASVRFIDTTLQLGYQWVWSSGLNIAVSAGAAKLTRRNRDMAISPNESISAADYLNQQTSSNVHAASGILFGWAF